MIGELATPAARNPARRMTYSGLALGLALLTALLAYEGVGEVVRALAAAGGSGLLAVALFHLLPMFADAMGWRRLFAPTERPPFSTLLFARWVSEAVNSLLPVMLVGGSVVRARMIARRGVPGPRAGATVVVDVTLLVMTQLVFAAAGIGLLLAHLGGRAVAPAAATGLALMALGVAGFYLAQRLGVFAAAARALARVRRSDHGSLVADAAALDRAVAALHRDRRAILVGSAWHLTGWFLGVGEVWLALRVLGHPIDLVGATMLESLGQSLRAAAFAVPGALGVLEGGFLVLGSLLGIPPETALALSLAKRVREITLGLPALVAWQLDGRASARVSGKVVTEG